MSEYDPHLDDDLGTLPKDWEAEKCLVACALTEGATDTVLSMAAERGITEKHFDWAPYRYIWEVIVMLRKEEPARDATMATIGKVLQEQERWRVNETGAQLNALYYHLPSAAHAKQYMDQVVESWQRRALILACHATMKAGYQGAKVSEETLPLIENLQAELADISAVSSAESCFTDLQAMLRDSYLKLMARYKMRGRFSGITSGIADLDRMTDGFEPGQLILIAGRPSMGKTAELFQFGLHAALKNSYDYKPETWRAMRVPVGAFSAEMSDDMLGQRFLSQLTGVSLKSFATGFMKTADLDKAQDKMVKVLENIEGVVFKVDDTPSLSIQQLEARARQLVLKYGVKIILVDYAQLLTSNSKKAEANRLAEVSEVSMGLKRIARILGVVMIVAVQLNRDVDDRPGHVPYLSDMRECGQLEQDADLVICPVRPEYYAKSEEQRSKAVGKYKLDQLPLDSGPANDFLAANYAAVSHMTEDEQRLFLLDGYAELHVIKHRGGPTGMVKCWFYKERCWFEGWTRKPFSNNENERQANLDENHGEEAAA